MTASGTRARGRAGGRNDSRPKIRAVRPILILGISILVGAPIAAASSADRIVKVGPGANGTTVLLRPADQLVVSLPGNATTGYSWRVRSVDRTVLKPTGITYVPKKTVPPKVGSGGTYVLHFRVVGAGATSLKLVYVRAGGSIPAKRYGLKVEVKGPPKV
jgi:predicted secreted protein